jgi:hypothetical protein
VKTVKVRVAVAVDSAAHWNAAGFCCDGDERAVAAAMEPLIEQREKRVYWLTAELPVPEMVAAEIAANVEDTPCD